MTIIRNLPFMALLAGIWLTMLASPAQAYNHAYYNDLRGYHRTMYFSSSLHVLGGTMEHEGNTTEWRGYGVENGVGTQLFKFLHLELSHLMTSMTAADADTQHVSGSKINGKVKMSFESPIGNLELGFGSHIGSLGYLRDGKATDLTTTGHQYGVGLNYFTSDKLSLHGTVSQSEERWSKSRGADFSGVTQTTVRSFAFGVSLWR